MPVRVAAHERTVHPDLARAALLGVRRHGRSALADEVALRQAAGRGVAEDLHHAVLRELSGYGWQALRDAAGHLLDRPREHDVHRLIERGSVPDLVAHLPAVQLRFHAGHTTRLRLHRRRIAVTHRPLLGAAPDPAESLFTAAIHQTLVGACAGRRPALAVRFADGTVLHDEATATAPVPAPVPSLTGRGRVDGWELDLGPGPCPGAAGSSAAEVRAMVSADPARSWRLETAAARSGTSPRSLQRALAAEGTGFRTLLTETRLGLARGLVQRTDLGLAEIAAACGFTDHAHLTRCFTSRLGVAPSRLRS